MVDFHSARLFLGILRCFLWVFKSFGVSEHHGGWAWVTFQYLHLFAFLKFWAFLAIFDVFGAFWGFQLRLGRFESNIELWGNEKDYIGCREGHWSVLGGVWGVQRYFGGSRGAPRGSILPRWSTFCPSGSLVQHQNWFQVPHNGSTGQASPSMHHWPNFGTLGPFKGPPKDHFVSKSSPIGTQIVQNLAFRPLKRSWEYDSNGPKSLDLVPTVR